MASLCGDRRSVHSDAISTLNAQAHRGRKFSLRCKGTAEDVLCPLDRPTLTDQMASFCNIGAVTPLLLAAVTLPFGFGGQSDLDQAANGNRGRSPDVLFYFSRRSFGLVPSAISIRRRIASDRVGLSFWCLAQVSIADLRSIGSRTVRVGSCPVAGRPRPRFFCVTAIDSLPILCDT
jgi:hypothetical protein